MGGQPSYRLLHHSGCVNSRLDILFHYLTSGRCVNSCLDILFHYLTSGRFTRAPQVFTDLIPQHLTSHKGWPMFFVAWYILISTNQWRMDKSCEIDLVGWYYFLLIFLVLILLEKTLIFLRLMPIFGRILLRNVLLQNKLLCKSFSRMLTNDLMCYFVELSFRGYLKTVGGK